MELSERNMREPLRVAGRFLPLILAGAVLLAVTFVQHGRAPESVEIAVRGGAHIAALLAVPLLFVGAIKNWTRESRMKLSIWRNGFALTSVVLVLLVWLSSLLTGTVYAGFQKANFVFHLDPLSLFATLLYSNLLAGLLAMALPVRPRVLILSAVLLLWSGMEAGIYF